jgi:hypothetical protein
MEAAMLKAREVYIAVIRSFMVYGAPAWHRLTDGRAGGPRSLAKKLAVHQHIYMPENRHRSIQGSPYTTVRDREKQPVLSLLTQDRQNGSWTYIRT